MKKLLALAATATVAASLAVPALAARTKSIKVGDDYFVRAGSKPTVKVRKGTVVKWVWRGNAAHNVKATGPQKFKSRTFVKGSFKHKMTKRGKYRIICTIHPGMAMTLKVR